MGTLRVAGFPVLPTGANPDHYDVQLLPGRLEGSSPADIELGRAAGLLLDSADDSQPNPAYAVGTDEPTVKER